MEQQNRRMVEIACAIVRKTHSKRVLLYADMIEHDGCPCFRRVRRNRGSSYLSS